MNSSFPKIVASRLDKIVKWESGEQKWLKAEESYPWRPDLPKPHYQSDINKQSTSTFFCRWFLTRLFSFSYMCLRWQEFQCWKEKNWKQKRYALLCPSRAKLNTTVIFDRNKSHVGCRDVLLQYRMIQNSEKQMMQWGSKCVPWHHGLSGTLGACHNYASICCC